MAIEAMVAMDDCPDCEAHRRIRLHGGYRMQCVQCCARLLRSARPMRGAQNALLAAIRHHPDAPETVEILDALKQYDLELSLAQIEPAAPVFEVVEDSDLFSAEPPPQFEDNHELETA